MDDIHSVRLEDMGKAFDDAPYMYGLALDRLDGRVAYDMDQLGTYAHFPATNIAK